MRELFANLQIQHSSSFFLLLLWLSLTAPVFMTPPTVSPLSPHSLNVSWEMPADNITRGRVVGYNVTMISEQSPRQSHPVVFSQVLLFSTNVLSELNCIFILIFSVFVEFGDSVFPQIILKWNICFLILFSVQQAPCTYITYFFSNIRIYWNKVGIFVLHKIDFFYLAYPLRYLAGC